MWVSSPEGTASTGALESISLHLPDCKLVLVTFSGNQLSAFPSSWLFSARDEGSAWGGGRSLPVSLLLVSRDTAPDEQQELRLNPGLQHLLW